MVVSSALEPTFFDIYKHHLVQSSVDSALGALEVQLMFEQFMSLFFEAVMHLCC